MQIQTNNSAIYVGVYYGKQEHAPLEEIKAEFAQLTAQVINLKQRGEIILTGDFNAKLEINDGEITQHKSRNGAIMEEFIQNTGIDPISLKPQNGHWTRENRHNASEKSVIDYVLTTPNMTRQTKNLVIDEDGLLRMKGKNESDHNTITLQVKEQIQKDHTKRWIWRTNNKEAWHDFNKEMETTSVETTESYDCFEKHLKALMTRHLGKITIKPGAIRKPSNPEIKRLKREKKEAKKELKEARKNNGNATEKMTQYLETQKQLREEIEQYHKQRIQKITENITKNGGVNSREFWKIRKRILNQKTCEYDLVTEDDEKITDGNRQKEYIATYYEDLYQAREGNPGYERWTKHIKRTVKSLEAYLENAEDETPFSMKELEIAIRSLKTRKCPGPDNIPNEIFTKSSKATRYIYLNMFNKILRKREIPPQWLNGNITRLYKGKGTKGKCSNERGITLASNIGKLFERMVNNRATLMADMTDAQAGGQKGRAITDHLLTLKEAINAARTQKQPVYATFLDVTKAYDKAWIDAIMYVMNQRGINSQIWAIIKKLNENLTATIQTKFGPTRKNPYQGQHTTRGGPVSTAICPAYG